MKLRGFFSTLVGLFVLAILLFLAGRIAVQSYLHGERFRHTISSATAKFLRASCEYAPFRFSGTSVYSDALTASGRSEAAFAHLRAEQMRADVNVRSIFRGTWEIPEVVVQRLDISTGGPREESAPEEMPTTSKPGWLANLLPKNVELKRLNVRSGSVDWTGGALKNTQALVESDGRTWKIALNGGALAQAGLPAMTLNAANLRYNAPALFINDCALTCDDGGAANVSGAVDFQRALDLHCELTGISITPLLTPDWRAKLHGALAGTVDVHADFPLREPVLTGDVQLQNGRLEALPILDQIALFTQSQQFRTLDLSRASGKFRQSGAQLQVNDFIAESEGLLCMKGAFSIVNGMIDGTFQVGVTASSLRWLPGSQERVFNNAHDGYCWAPMRLTGPADHPQEDLSPRLIAAAKDKVIEDTSGAIKQTTDSVLDILKPLLK